MHAILFAVLSMLVQQPAPAVPPPPALVVTGNARILATPDEATVRLGIVRQAPAAQAAQEQALKEAVEEARSKAQVMADAVRVAIIEVLEVSEGGVSAVDRFEPAMAGRALAAAAPETPVSPGQIEVRASVTIRYRIAMRQ